MCSYDVRPITVAEAFEAPLFGALCAEYRDEALRNPDLIGCAPDRAAYETMEARGIVRPLGVFAGGELVGFCAVLVTPSLHCGGNIMASTEALFVASEHRAGGAGVALLQAADQEAAKAGAAGLYVSAPVDGRLERVLPRCGFKAVNTIFYRSLKR